MTSGRFLLGFRHCGRLAFLIGAVSFFTFLMMNLAPGDPAEILLSDRFETPSPENIAALRKELGLNDPFFIRYVRWLKDIGRLNLGRSYRTGDPVAAELASRIPATALLAAATFVFTVVVSIGTGTLGALFYNRIPDRICRFWNQVPRPPRLAEAVWINKPNKEKAKNQSLMPLIVALVMTNRFRRCTDGKM